MHVFSEHEMYKSTDLETLILTFNTLGACKMRKWSQGQNSKECQH